MTDETEENKLFLNTEVHIRKITNAQTFHYTGQCISINKQSITIIDRITKKPINFSRQSDITIEAK